MISRFAPAQLTAVALLVAAAGCRDQAVDADADAGAMRGMFRYLADAAVFSDCVTGQRLPVAMAEGYISLERAYLEARPEPGGEMLVSFAGRIEERPPMEGDGTVPTVVVERYEGVWPGETCGNAGMTEALENTYWKLTRLGDRPVRVLVDHREAHLVLQKEEGRAVGTGGCNRVGGGYELADVRLTFGDMMSTRMACPEIMEQEYAFLQALAAVASWRIEGQHLELLDADGERLLRLEARAFP